MIRTKTKRERPTLGRRLASFGRGKSSRNGSRPERVRDRTAKRRALILAALELFARKGYESTTTREIAASAGCAEGLIHRYFKGKAGLLAALIEYRVSKEALDSSSVLQPSLSPPSPSLEDEFVHLVDREVQRMWESRDFLRVFISRAIVDPAIGSVLNKALISASGKTISERLKHYESCRKMPADAVEVLTQAVGMLGLVFGFVRPVLLRQDRSRAKKMAAAVAKILVSNPAYSISV
jgi:AcrR family transcriptional regulator